LSVKCLSDTFTSASLATWWHIVLFPRISGGSN